MTRKIIHIDEEKCTGCGLCIPNCAEGALQIIDGKARLISDLFCDGLGACIGHCPEQAITITEREAEAYDEDKVLAERIIPAGENTLREHLLHLQSHGAEQYFKQALHNLQRNHIANPLEAPKTQYIPHTHGSGCPGSQVRTIIRNGQQESCKVKSENEATIQSELSHWPIQLHLINPSAPYFYGAELLLAADCVAYARADMHSRFLRGKKLIILCPKLDHEQENYFSKLIKLLEEAHINSITILRMEVPCCGGIVSLAQKAVKESSRSIPIKEIIIGIDGDIRSENWSLD